MVMRRFILDLKPDGSVKWAEAVDSERGELSAYKKIAEHCETMMYLFQNNKDKYEAYRNVLILCKRLGNLW